MESYQFLKAGIDRAMWHCLPAPVSCKDKAQKLQYVKENLLV